jgi:uncharacterized protein (DUF2252 family)
MNGVGNDQGTILVKEENTSFKRKEFPGSGRTREEAASWGKTLRNKTSRAIQAGWEATAERADTVELLMQSSEGRDEHLIPIRYGRMLQSPFTFFRGAAAVMAADLATTPCTGLYVQSCGDCHLMNFGAFATPERKLVFDINDFDETLPAPWEWDLKRLATSFVIASQSNHYSKAASKDTAKECVQSYRLSMAAYAQMTPLALWYTTISLDDVMKSVSSEVTRKRFEKRLEKAQARSIANEDYPKLAEIKKGKIGIKDNPPLIYHRTEHEPAEYLTVVDQVYKRYVDSLSDEKRTLLNQYRIVDIAAKVVGIGSVGTRCSIVLLMTNDNEPLFLQVKEARTSVLEKYTEKNMYSTDGQRVVLGQKLMQASSDIFLGWTDAPGGRHFYIRQLRDMKIKPLVEIFDERTMIDYARLCGKSLARAHARSSKAAVISGYLGSSDKFDQAIADFAVSYSAQNEKDYDALQSAVRSGKLEAYFEE